ncbi:chitin synthase, partial [Tremellales sp. Uapishka_1]
MSGYDHRQDDHRQPPSRTAGLSPYTHTSQTILTRSPSPSTPTRTHPDFSQSSPFSSQYSQPTNSYYSTQVNRAPSPQAGPEAHELMTYSPYDRNQSSPYNQPPRPSMSSFQSDYPDETKSYTSTTNLHQKEYGLGELVPPVPYHPQQLYLAQQHPGYPPRPSPSPLPQYGYPQSPSSQSGTSHWHAMRAGMLERRVIKQIPLSNGNLIMDIAVPRSVIPSTKGLGLESDEMETMRYSAATCDPDNFMKQKFNLRQYLYGRKTELFIVMTMYNENSELFLKTLNAVIKNITHLTSRSRSKTWGTESWKKVVICIVADGRKVIDSRVLKVLQLMGVYAEGVAKDTVGGKETQAHVFEYTSQVIVSETGEVGFGSVPIQILFCLKEQNKKKLNSHRWFFNAFGPLIKPNVCILLDVGTRPSGTSIYELYKVFERHSDVGGACGEIFADTGMSRSELERETLMDSSGKMGRYLLNPLVAGQNFEYKMSNILDKPFESVFGLISVLPGAFSAYRYAAVANHPDGTGPLASYFHGEMMNLPGATASIFDRNKFLAEDRILAFEIVVKKNARWRLHYVKSAKASTDVPSTVPEFISQRRRWLNGSIFAATYAMICFWRIWTSGHGFIRKILLNIVTIYNLINLLFNWFSVSSFYLAFFFLIDSSTSGSSDPFGGYGQDVFEVFNKVYIGLIFIVLICSLGNRPQGTNWMYTLCILLFAICQGLLLYCAGWTVYQTVPHTAAGWSDVSALFSNKTFLDLALSLMATYGLYLISSILYFEPWHMITSFIQYLLLLPSYVNILLIYAFCNLHDVSWGTKGDNGASKDLGQAKKVEKDGKEMAEVAIPTKPEDMEMLWQQARQELRVPAKEVKEKRSAETKRNDASIKAANTDNRTNVVLLFLGSNMILILLFTSSVFTTWINSHFSIATGTSFNPYLTAIFYMVLGLSVLRFVGCVAYLLLRLVGF